MGAGCEEILQLVLTIGALRHYELSYELLSNKLSYFE